MRISHIAWNLGGLTVPLAVAALTVPRLLDMLGHERFGLLALAWGLIGFAGALDLGVGRALTQRVARLRGEKNSKSIADTLVTASRLTLYAGLVAGVVIVLWAMLGGSRLIKTVSTPEIEITVSILLLAIALPAQAMSATYKGLNEAFMNFKGINFVRAALGVISFVGPYVVAHFTTQMPLLVSTLVLSRLASLLVYKKLASNCLKNQPEALPATGHYSAPIARDIFSFSGWVTISSVVSPIMVQADRFFIASVISASAVSAYVLPYEVVVQCLVLSGAVSSVMFPSLSRLIREQPNEWKSYFKQWLTRVIILMSATLLVVASLLPYILQRWLGSSLDPVSVTVGQILCIGVFSNSLGSMYFAAIHAMGRADVTAKIHMLELPIFFILLYFLILKYGVPGAAIAWSMRTTFDAVLLALATRKLHT